MKVKLRKETRRLLERIMAEDDCSIERAVHFCVLYVSIEREQDPDVRRARTFKMLREVSE